MDDLMLDGLPPIPVALRRSARARRLTLRISRFDGRVTLTLPRGTGRRVALAFAREKEDWIRDHLDATPEQVCPHRGGTVLFEGRETPLLVTGSGRAARLEDGAIALPPGAPERDRPRLAALFKALARDRLAEATTRHAAVLGREVTAISLRDPRSRWGSCSPAGRLMFSWRLVMAPPEVLDYVAAHEVAHLAEMNHSSAFWAEVARLCPGYAAPRAWLRTNGALLHRYRFSD